jgi:tetratricopeptide (TPR) repeat protein
MSALDRVAPAFAAWLARLGRQLLLVPEAIVLLVLLSLYNVHGGSLLLTTLGLCVALWFGLRIGLLIAARHALDRANYPRAEALARWALSLYPYSADALALAGTIQLTFGQPEAASNLLRQAVRCYPWQPGLYTTLAIALLEAGRTREALVAARRALALDPAYGPAYLPLAEAEAQLGAEIAVVEAWVQQGLRCAAPPADTAALQCALAECFLKREEVGNAQTALRAAEALLGQCFSVQRAGLHFQLGALWQQCGDPEAARNHFAASADLDPHGPYAAAAWRAART